MSTRTARIALAWLTHHDRFTTVPIVGARTPEQLEESLGAADVELTDAQFDSIVDARYDEDGDRYRTWARPEPTAFSRPTAPSPSCRSHCPCSRPGSGGAASSA